MRERSLKFNKLMITLLIISAFMLCACEKNEDDNEVTDEILSDTASHENNDEDNTTEEEKNFGIDVGENWKYAYNDGTYVFYYLNVSYEIYDTNIVMSITKDDNLKGVDVDKLKESLEMENTDASVSISDDTEGKNKVVYMQTEEKNGEEEAVIGQYIVIGEKETLIFSVYAEKGKFETAREKTRLVVDNVSID